MAEIVILRRYAPRPNRYEWHDWFAWYPVVATNEHGEVCRIWLEQARRKYDTQGDWGDGVQYTFTERNV